MAKEKHKDIKKEIRTRLEILNPKLKNVVKCLRFGKNFNQRVFGYANQKTCNDCWNKARVEEDFRDNI